MKFIYLFIILLNIIINISFASVNIGFIHCKSDLNFRDDAIRSERVMELAVENQNKNGGILGQDIKLHVFDTSGIPIFSKDLVAELERRNIKGIVGFFGCTDDLALAPLIERVKIPTIMPTATDPRLMSGKRFLAQVCVDDASQAKVLAEYVYFSGHKRVIVAKNLADIFTENYYQSFKFFFQNLGGEIVGSKSTHLNLIKYREVAHEIKQLESQASAIVLFQNTLDSFYTWIELKALGFKLPFYSDDRILMHDIKPIIRFNKTDFQIERFIAHYDPTDQESKSNGLIRSYNSIHSDYPISAVNAESFFTYDSALALFSAFNRAKSISPEKVIHQLRIQKYQGKNIGLISFSSDGKSKRNLNLLRFKNGSILK